MSLEILKLIIRHALTAGGTYLAAQGITDSASVEQGIGAICTIVGLVWSGHRKWQRAKEDAAKATPGAAPVAAAPPATTTADASKN